MLRSPLEEVPCVVALERRLPPFDWEEIFGRATPVELEVGCGKGLYLVEAARLRPHCGFVGVERAGKWFHRAVERVHRSQLTNIRLVRADALDILTRWVPADSLAAGHVYFPDPWPKRRHAPRRLLQEPLYSLLTRALRPGGTFFLATDVEPYFRQAVATIRARTELAEVSWPEDSPDRLPTNYARKYALEGRNLYYARFVRGARDTDGAIPPAAPGGGTSEEEI